MESSQVGATISARNYDTRLGVSEIENWEAYDITRLYLCKLCRTSWSV